MGILINPNGKVGYDGAKTPINIMGTSATCKILSKTVDTTISGAIGTTTLTNFIPDGSLVLGMTCRILRTFTATTITAAVIDDSTTNWIVLTSKIASNAIAAGILGDPRDAIAVASPKFFNADTNARLILTGTGTQDGQFRLTMFYIQTFAA